MRFGDDSAPEHFFLGDIRETDGTPWSCCPRDFLRRGAGGARGRSPAFACSRAFEQEFVYTGVEELPGAAYSLDAYRRQGIFGEAFTAALRQAGREPGFLPAGIWRPAIRGHLPAGTRGQAADDAIVMREIARRPPSAWAHRPSSRPSSIPTASAMACISI